MTNQSKANKIPSTTLTEGLKLEYKRLFAQREIAIRMKSTQQMDVLRLQFIELWMRFERYQIALDLPISTQHFAKKIILFEKPYNF